MTGNILADDVGNSVSGGRGYHSSLPRPCRAHEAQDHGRCKTTLPSACLPDRVRIALILLSRGAGFIVTAVGVADLIPRWLGVTPGVALVLGSLWLLRPEIARGVKWLARYRTISLVIMVLFLTGAVMWDDSSALWDSVQASREAYREKHAAAVDRARCAAECWGR